LISAPISKWSLLSLLGLKLLLFYFTMCFYPLINSFLYFYSSILLDYKLYIFFSFNSSLSVIFFSFLFYSSSFSSKLPSNLWHWFPHCRLKVLFRPWVTSELSITLCCLFYETDCFLEAILYSLLLSVFAIETIDVELVNVLFDGLLFFVYNYELVRVNLVLLYSYYWKGSRVWKPHLEVILIETDVWLLLACWLPQTRSLLKEFSYWLMLAHFRII